MKKKNVNNLDEKKNWMRATGPTYVTGVSEKIKLVYKAGRDWGAAHQY